MKNIHLQNRKLNTAYIVGEYKIKVQKWNDGAALTLNAQENNQNTGESVPI